MNVRLPDLSGGIARSWGYGGEAPIFSTRFQSPADPYGLLHFYLKTSVRKLAIPEKVQ
jgi:hypothetical protein